MKELILNRNDKIAIVTSNSKIINALKDDLDNVFDEECYLLLLGVSRKDKANSYQNFLVNEKRVVFFSEQGVMGYDFPTIQHLFHLDVAHFNYKEQVRHKMNRLRFGNEPNAESKNIYYVYHLNKIDHHSFQEAEKSRFEQWL